MEMWLLHWQLERLQLIRTDKNSWLFVFFQRFFLRNSRWPLRWNSSSRIGIGKLKRSRGYAGYSLKSIDIQRPFRIGESL